MYLNIWYLGLFVVLLLCVSCAKEMSLLSTRAGRYKCFNDSRRRCGACIPQDTTYSYYDTILLTYRNDTFFIKDAYSVKFITTDSFINESVPQWNGMYWRGKFIGDSLNLEFYQNSRQVYSENSSKCRLLK